jgi:hypothetical protein
MKAFTTGLRTVIYPVNDIEAAKRMYGALWGVEPVTDEPSYVGYQVPAWTWAPTRRRAQGRTVPTGYWHVADLEATMVSLGPQGNVHRPCVATAGE